MFENIYTNLMISCEWWLQCLWTIDTLDVEHESKGSEIRKQLLKWLESCHLWKIKGQASPQIVPSFAARIYACFAHVEAPGGKSGNY